MRTHTHIHAHIQMHSHTRTRAHTHTHRHTHTHTHKHRAAYFQGFKETKFQGLIKNFVMFCGQIFKTHNMHKTQQLVYGANKLEFAAVICGHHIIIPNHKIADKLKPCHCIEDVTAC